VHDLGPAPFFPIAAAALAAAILLGLSQRSWRQLGTTGASGRRERRAALRSRVGFALVEAGLRLVATRPPDHFSP